MGNDKFSKGDAEKDGILCSSLSFSSALLCVLCVSAVSSISSLTMPVGPIGLLAPAVFFQLAEYIAKYGVAVGIDGNAREVPGRVKTPPAAVVEYRTGMNM